MTRAVYTRLFKAIQAQVASARQGPGHCSKRHLVVAAVVLGKRVIARSNQYTTHPVMKRISRGAKECLHAEVAVLGTIGDPSIRGPMLVVRETRAGELRLAKPCRYCTAYIWHAFPKLRVFYSTGDGEFVLLGTEVG